MWFLLHTKLEHDALDYTIQRKQEKPDAMQYATKNEHEKVRFSLNHN